MARFRRYLAVAAISVLAAACGKEYDFLLVNDSPFTLLKVNVEDQSFFMEPNGDAVAFTQKLPDCLICLSRQGVMIHVAKFADSTRAHEQSSANWIALSEFSTRKVNTLRIHVDSSNSRGLELHASLVK